MNVVLKAGLSTIQSISVAKGEQVWWEISVSGDIGFGVLFKKTSTEETGEKVAPETVEKIRRVDPAMEEIRLHLKIRWERRESRTVEGTWSARATEPLSLDSTIVFPISGARRLRLSFTD